MKPDYIIAIENFIKTLPDDDFSGKIKDSLETVAGLSRKMPFREAHSVVLGFRATLKPECELDKAIGKLLNSFKKRKNS